MNKTFLISHLKTISDRMITFKKIATIPRDDYTTGCLRNYSYFKKHYKLTAIDLNKQQALDADSKNIQQQWCNHY